MLLGRPTRTRRNGQRRIVHQKPRLGDSLAPISRQENYGGSAAAFTDDAACHRLARRAQEGVNPPGLGYGATAAIDSYIDRGRGLYNTIYVAFNCIRPNIRICTDSTANLDERRLLARIASAGTPCCMDRRYGRIEPDPCYGLRDADVLWASQLQHSVQHVGRDGYLGRLSPVGLEA
jgi:hypothetical protein